MIVDIPDTDLVKELSIKYEEYFWCIGRRIWDPEKSSLWKSSKSVKEKILSIIDNIRRLWNFIQEMIVKNDDLIILGLILKKENNGITNLLTSKAFISKASCEFTLYSSML